MSFPLIYNIPLSLRCIFARWNSSRSRLSARRAWAFISASMGNRFSSKGPTGSRPTPSRTEWLPLCEFTFHFVIFEKQIDSWECCERVTSEPARSPAQLKEPVGLGRGGEHERPPGLGGRSVWTGSILQPLRWDGNHGNYRHPSVRETLLHVPLHT